MMLTRLIKIFAFALLAACGLLPILNITGGEVIPWLSGQVVATLNILGWGLVLVFAFTREELRQSLWRHARELGVDTRFSSFDALLENVIKEVSRRNSCLSLNILERRITSKEELSRTLERIVALAFRLLDAESAELALFDKESGMYHSSFVLGKPFSSSSQAMLSGALEGLGEETAPDVLVQPLAFAGSVLGSLRIGLRKGRLPTSADQEILRLLALQGGLALINAQYTEQLVRMRQASEESVKAKTGFLANLSHEIRGPLGIMLNAVELVLDGLCGPVSGDQLETLKMVRSNGEHLLELINDVLDYAKVESGRIEPNKVSMLVDDLLKDITNVVRSQAETKSHKLAFKASDEALAISCDRRHARQMLINLLTNAIKYTPDGGSIDVWAERAPGGKIKINVRDTGVGIESSERHKVFAPFERVDNAYSIKQVGAGLGMPLTKKLAEVNDATIDFRSAPGKGSQFWLSFNAVSYDASIVRESPKEELEASGKGELVLVVARDDGERRMVARYLTHIGFNVALANLKVEALEVMRNRRVSLVIIDNNSVDNVEGDLVKALRDNASSKTLPVLLLSSRAFVFDIEKYLRAGIDRCLIKPLELKNLGVTCRTLIDGTYSGAVIDDAEVKVPKKRERQKTPLESTRVINLDDILH